MLESWKTGRKKRHGAIIRNEARRTQESQEKCENSALTVGALHPFPAMSDAEQLGSRKDSIFFLMASQARPWTVQSWFLLPKNGSYSGDSD